MDTLSENDSIVHAKRVSQILRYISTLQTGTGGDGQFLFVRDASQHSRPFYSNNSSEMEDDSSGRVLFTTYDFQQLLAAAEAAGGKSRPFSFYTTSPASTKSRKRTAWGTVKTEPGKDSKSNSACCWLRLTRMASTETKTMPHPSLQSAHVQSYLHHWSTARKKPVDQLLTLRYISSAPSSTNPQVVKFLRRVQEHLHQKYLHRRLERIYNGLFEWYDGSGGVNSSHELDLVWGMGQAILKDEVNGVIVDGPLLEVKVEVELARDGALLIRPRQHTGVTWNRSVMAALDSMRESAMSKKWNQLVDALDPLVDINPSEPTTYVPLLKQLAVEYAAGGNFVPSGSCDPTSLCSPTADGKLVITDAWCLYASPRPSAVWARDALAFCEQPPDIIGSSTKVSHPPALWALTHGPSALETVCRMMAEQQRLARSNHDSSAEPRIHFPLPTSEAQNRIAQLLLTKSYPAVVCEGPPGTVSHDCRLYSMFDIHLATQP